MGAARGAVGRAGGDRLAPVRARPRGVRVAAPHAGGSRARSPAGGSRSCRPAPPSTRTRRSRTSSARSSPTPRPPARALDGAIRFFEGAGVARRRSSSSPRRSWSSRAAARRPRRSRSSSRRSSAGARRSRPRSARSASRSRSRAASGSARPPLGQALLALLRFAWPGAAAATSTRFLRSPFSGFTRANVDFLEGRLRGRGVARASGRGGDDRASRRPAAAAARGAPRRAATRSRPSARSRPRCCAARTASRRRRWASRARPTCAPTTRSRGSLDELDGWRRSAASSPPTTCVAALERAEVRLGSAGEPGRVAVLDLLRARARAASRSSSCSGSRRAACRAAATPRRSSTTTLAASSTGDAARGSQRPDPVERDRYLFYTACTRATRRLYLVREAATDEGSPREPSPFWDEVAALFDPRTCARWTRRRPLSQLTWPLEAAPTERERLRALALLGSRPSRDGAQALAAANGWERQLERAPTRVHARDAAARTRSCSSELVARRRRSTSPSSSASPTARRRGSSSG